MPLVTVVNVCVFGNYPFTKFNQINEALWSKRGTKECIKRVKSTSTRTRHSNSLTSGSTSGRLDSLCRFPPSLGVAWRGG